MKNPSEITSEDLIEAIKAAAKNFRPDEFTEILGRPEYNRRVQRAKQREVEYATGIEWHWVGEQVGDRYLMKLVPKK